MRAVLVTGLLGFCGPTAIGAPVPAAPAPGKDDGDGLRGTSQCVKLVVNGRAEPPTPPGEGDRSLMVYFTPGKVEFGQLDGKGGVARGRPVPFRIDPAASPRRIDIGGEKAMKGIYALDGNRLRLMHPLVAGKDDPARRDRPEEIETKASDGQVYMELERVKP